MLEKREITQDHLDGMAEAFKIANIYGVPKETTDKEMADLLANCTIKKADATRQIQIDVITNTKEVQALNVEVEKAKNNADQLAISLQKLGVNFLAV